MKRTRRIAGTLAAGLSVALAIVINRSGPARDVVFNRAAIGGERSPSGVIAHERTHGLIRARYGLFADLQYPAWLREGYCDVVAGGGSVSDRDVALLDARHETSLALRYYEGGRRVEAALRANRGSVDALFGKADAAL